MFTNIETKRTGQVNVRTTKGSMHGRGHLLSSNGVYGVAVRLTFGGAGRGRRSPQPPEGVSHPREPVTRRGVCNAVTTQLRGCLLAAAAAPRAPPYGRPDNYDDRPPYALQHSVTTTSRTESMPRVLKVKACTEDQDRRIFGDPSATTFH